MNLCYNTIKLQIINNGDDKEDSDSELAESRQTVKDGSKVITSIYGF